MGPTSRQEVGSTGYAHIPRTASSQQLSPSGFEESIVVVLFRTASLSRKVIAHKHRIGQRELRIPPPNRAPMCSNGARSVPDFLPRRHHSLEAGEAAKGESPGAALDAVPVGVDAGAEATAADALVPHKTHGCC